MRKISAPLLLLLVASLGLASARADVIKPNVPGVPAVTVPVETELIADEEEDGEEVEWDEEEEGEDEWEEWEAGEEPPFECLLRSASARAIVSEKQDKLRLTIRYSAFEPTEGTVDYKLRGSKGSLRLPQARQRLSEHGVVQITEPLTAAEAERARAARDFTVKFHIPDAPSECQSAFTRHLTIKRVVHGQLTFRQSGSIFGGDS